MLFVKQVQGLFTYFEGLLLGGLFMILDLLEK